MSCFNLTSVCWNFLIGVGFCAPIFILCGSLLWCSVGATAYCCVAAFLFSTGQFVATAGGSCSRSSTSLFGASTPKYHAANFAHAGSRVKKGAERLQRSESQSVSYLQSTRKPLMVKAINWWARQVSNLRPSDYESPALTPELRARTTQIRALAFKQKVRI